MKKIVGVASTPNRVDGLKDMIESLYSQVDTIYVWLNGYDSIPDVPYSNVHFIESKENVGDIGKLLVRDHIVESNEDFYFFTCDDDIIYPPDYVDRNIDQYTPNSFQSAHTGLYKSYPIVTYYKETQRGNNIPTFFVAGCNQKFAVHLGGTGVMMFTSDMLWDIPVEDFMDHKNMLDVWIAVYAHENDIPIYTIVRDNGWIRENNRIAQNTSIFHTDQHRGDAIQTQIINHYFCQKPNKHQPVPIYT